MWTLTESHGPPIYYRRKIFQASHDTYKGSFAVDFTVEPHDDLDETLPPRTAYFPEEQFARIGSDDSKPMLIVLHGLSGGSYEIYLRYVIAPLVENGEWEVCVVNSRGCANTKITSGVLFNARATWDVRQVVGWAQETFPNRPLFGLGFSLGANIMTNYVGEEGASCPLTAAIAVANPFNLETCNKALRRKVLGKEVYLRAMGGYMKNLANHHREEILKYTDLDWDVVNSLTYLYEFDRVVQTKCWGYPTEESYYRDASSADAVLAIRIPYFAISAIDDPIAVDEAVPYEEFKHNPYTILCSTTLGGHLSWFELGGGRWHACPICNLLQTFVSQIDLAASKSNASSGSDTSDTSFHPMRRKLEILRP